MELKLCYKTYNYKMTLGAMRKFKESSGHDLWNTLIKFIDVFSKSDGVNVQSRMSALYGVCDFYLAAKVFHCMIKEEDDSISLAEIEDGMFRVGWLPNDKDDSEMCQPWPLIMVKCAFDISANFTQNNTPKKKADT